MDTAKFDKFLPFYKAKTKFDILTWTKYIVVVSRLKLQLFFESLPTPSFSNFDYVTWKYHPKFFWFRYYLYLQKMIPTPYKFSSHVFIEEAKFKDKLKFQFQSTKRRHLISILVTF